MVQYIQNWRSEMIKKIDEQKLESLEKIKAKQQEKEYLVKYLNEITLNLDKLQENNDQIIDELKALKIQLIDAQQKQFYAYLNTCFLPCFVAKKDPNDLKDDIMGTIGLRDSNWNQAICLIDVDKFEKAEKDYLIDYNEKIKYRIFVEITSKFEDNIGKQNIYALSENNFLIVYQFDTISCLSEDYFEIVLANEDGYAKKIIKDQGTRRFVGKNGDYLFFKSNDGDVFYYKYNFDLKIEKEFIVEIEKDYTLLESCGNDFHIYNLLGKKGGRYTDTIEDYILETYNYDLKQLSRTKLALPNILYDENSISIKASENEKLYITNNQSLYVYSNQLQSIVNSIDFPYQCTLYHVDLFGNMLLGFEDFSYNQDHLCVYDSDFKQIYRIDKRRFYYDSLCVSSSGKITSIKNFVYD